MFPLAVILGFDPRIHSTSGTAGLAEWMAGSRPAMTW